MKKLILKFRLLFFVIIFSCFNFACTWTKSFDFDRVFYKKYDPEKINTSIHFPENGFFITQSKQSPEYYATIILFPDGIVNFEVHDKDSTSYINYLTELSLKRIPLKQGSWGYYYFEGKKLFITTTTFPYGMSKYSKRRVFIIQNANEIRLVNSTYSFGEDDTDWWTERYNNMTFVKIKNYPLYDCWLKQKRWFWADKKAYQDYKKKPF